MKYHFFTTLFLLGTLTLNAQNESIVSWEIDQTYDFGLLKHHEASSIKFPFINVSDEPITFDNVRVSCGCTAPSYDFEPIMPDSTGYLEIEFDAAKLGYFYKKIKVYFSHQRKAEILWIEGEVE